MKRERIATGTSISPSFRLTGSNQLLLDKNVKECLAVPVSGLVDFLEEISE